MKTTELPKARVILGAGACHDVWNGGAPITDSSWQPPLAEDLFDIAAAGPAKRIAEGEATYEDLLCWLRVHTDM